MTIEVTYSLIQTIKATILGVHVGDDKTYIVDKMNKSGGLSGTTVPPVTKYSSFEVPLVAGAATIDLTSLPDADGVAAGVTALGLKPQMFILRNKATNANAITLSKGASNGYTGFGSAFSFKLEPGDWIAFGGNDNAGVTDVGSGARTIDAAGTGAQVLEVHLIFG